ncbi:hypothetical protein AOLI_G00153660 [Acnodon oligacanthus]
MTCEETGSRKAAKIRRSFRLIISTAELEQRKELKGLIGSVDELNKHWKPKKNGRPMAKEQRDERKKDRNKQRSVRGKADQVKRGEEINGFTGKAAERMGKPGENSRGLAKLQASPYERKTQH